MGLFKSISSFIGNIPIIKNISQIDDVFLDIMENHLIPSGTDKISAMAKILFSIVKNGKLSSVDIITSVIGKSNGDEIIRELLKLFVTDGDQKNVQIIIDKFHDVINTNIAIECFNISISINAFEIAAAFTPFLKASQINKIISQILIKICKEENVNEKFAELLIKCDENGFVNLKGSILSNHIEIETIKNKKIKNMFKIYLEKK